MKKKNSSTSPTITRKEKQIMNKSNVKNEPLNPDIIFENKLLLECMITRLQKFLKKKLTKEDGRYLCNGDENLEHRWDATLAFCEREGIDDEFVGRLIEYLDYPDCEGDFLSDFPVEEVIKRIQEFDGHEKNEN